jgi:hypothetical protein
MGTESSTPVRVLRKLLWNSDNAFLITAASAVHSIRTHRHKSKPQLYHFIAFKRVRLFDQLLLFVFRKGSDGHAYAGILGYTASETAKQTGSPQRSTIRKSPAWASLLPQWCHRLLQKLQLLLHVLGNVETTGKCWTSSSEARWTPQHHEQRSWSRQ